MSVEAWANWSHALAQKPVLCCDRNVDNGVETSEISVGIQRLPHLDARKRMRRPCEAIFKAHPRVTLLIAFIRKSAIVPD